MPGSLARSFARSFVLSFAPSHGAQPPPRPLRTPPLLLCPAPAAPWEEAAAIPARQRPKGVRAASATHWPQEPSCRGAGASDPREGNSEGCAPRDPAPLASPTWDRRPPEPRQSSEAGSSSRTTKTRLSTEPPLPPGPSPVGSALLHLLESRYRHQVRFTSPLTEESLAFRPVAWANLGDQQHHWPPLPPAGTWPTPTTLQPHSYCSGGLSCGAVEGHAALSNHSQVAVLWHSIEAQQGPSPWSQDPGTHRPKHAQSQAFL